MSAEPAFHDWGLIEYSEALARQKELLAQRQANLIGDTFVFCEHPAVITVGRGKPKPGELPFIAPAHIPVIEVERGGLATYHGPGQLVCYPFVRLSPNSESQFPGGIVCFIRFLENWMVEVLQTFDVPACRVEGKTGVWVGSTPPQKLASIGIAVSRWVTYHGLALNFNTGKTIWQSFNPCGMSGNIMTDAQTQTGLPLTYVALKNKFIETFPRTLNILRSERAYKCNQTS